MPLTRPSHVSIFTGLLPTQHGIRDNVSPALVPQVPLLAELFRAGGFATGAFVSSVVLDSQSGLDRGFDVYADRFEGASGDAQFLNTVQKRGETTIAEAVAWLRGQAAGESSSGFTSTSRTIPTSRPSPTRPATQGAPTTARWRGPTSSSAASRTRSARSGSATTRRSSSCPTTAKGSASTRRACTASSSTRRRCTCRSWCARRGSRRGAASSARYGSSISSRPSLELAGLPPSKGALAGRSLAAALRGAPEPEEATTYAETLVPLLQFGWSDLRVIREGRFKYVQAPRPELYDLREDPGERRDLARERPQQVDAMRGALAKELERERNSRPQGGTRPSDEVVERLGALGYVGAGGAAETATPGADPKDKIGEFRVVNSLIREALLAFHAQDNAARVRKLRQVIARGVESFEVHYYLARALAAEGRYAEAGRHFDDAAHRVPAHASAWAGAAESRLQAGDHEGALQRLRSGQAAAPTDAVAASARGSAAAHARPPRGGAPRLRGCASARAARRPAARGARRAAARAGRRGAGAAPAEGSGGARHARLPPTGTRTA